MKREMVPYEFLVRWDHKSGGMVGAHVKVFDTIRDDAGNIIMQTEGDAQTVAMAGAAGFPLDAVLSAIQSGAVIAMDEAVSARQASEAALAATQTKLSETQLALDNTASALQAAETALVDALTKLSEMQQALDNAMSARQAAEAALVGAQGV